MTQSTRVPRWSVLAVGVLLAGLVVHVAARILWNELVPDRLSRVERQLLAMGWSAQVQGTAAAGEVHLRRSAPDGVSGQAVSIQYQHQAGPWLGRGHGVGLARVDFDVVVKQPFGPGSTDWRLTGTAGVNALLTLTVEATVSGYQSPLDGAWPSGTLSLEGVRAVSTTRLWAGDTRLRLTLAEAQWMDPHGPHPGLSWRLQDVAAELGIGPEAADRAIPSTLSLLVERIQVARGQDGVSTRSLELGSLVINGRLNGPAGPSLRRKEPKDISRGKAAAIVGSKPGTSEAGPPWPVTRPDILAFLDLLMAVQEAGHRFEITEGRATFDPSARLELEAQVGADPGRGTARIHANLAWLRSAVDAALRFQTLAGSPVAAGPDLLHAARSAAAFQALLATERRFPFGLREGDAFVAVLDWEHPALQLNGRPFLTLAPPTATPSASGSNR